MAQALSQPKGEKFGGTNDATLTWAAVEWVCGLSSLPVVVKGVLSPDDAKLAIAAGASGVVVSNHGGRQFDGAPTAIEALPAVVDAIGGRVPVLLDSGVRTATDIIRARCLGATAVLLGRPPLWGLACGGAEGLREMLGHLEADLKADLQSLGVKALDELGAHMLWPQAANEPASMPASPSWLRIG